MTPAIFEMGSNHLRPRARSVEPVQVGQEIVQFAQVLYLDTDAVQVGIHGGFTIVDGQDVVLLYERRWNVRRHRRTAYVGYQGSRETIRFARLLLAVTGKTVDHKNGIGWDNRRSNLRRADAIEQSRNHRPHRNKKYVEFKGVTFDPKKRLYRARIMVNHRSIGLGRYKSAIAAAEAYDMAAREYFGEFAVTNF